MLAGALGGATAACADVVFALSGAAGTPIGAAAQLVVTALSLGLCAGGLLGALVALALAALGPAPSDAVARALADRPMPGGLLLLAEGLSQSAIMRFVCAKLRA